MLPLPPKEVIKVVGYIDAGSGSLALQALMGLLLSSIVTLGVYRKAVVAKIKSIFSRKAK